MTIPLTSMTTKASAGASSTSTGVTEDGAGYAETLLMPGPGTTRPRGQICQRDHHKAVQARSGHCSEDRRDGKSQGLLCVQTLLQQQHSPGPSPELLRRDGTEDCAEWRGQILPHNIQHGSVHTQTKTPA